MEEFWNTLQERLENFAPDLVIGLAILIIGWIGAYLIAKLLQFILHKTTLDNKIAKFIVPGKTEKPIRVERTVGKIVYYILLLLVLALFFEQVQVPQISDAITSFTDQVFAYAPRILSAVALLFVAWLIARALRYITQKGLGALNLDERLNSSVEQKSDSKADDDEQTGDEIKTASQNVPITKVIGDTVYWLVFLFFLPAILDVLALGGILTPIQNLTNEIIGYLPNLVGAALILLVGWFAAKIIKNITENLLRSVGADSFSEKHLGSGAFGKVSISRIIGQTVYVLVLLPVCIAALGALDIAAVTEPATSMLQQVLNAVPSIFAAVLLGFLAYYIGKLLAGVTTNFLKGIGFDNFVEKLGIVTKSDRTSPSRAAGVSVMVGTILFIAIEALRQVGFGQAANLVSQVVVFGSQIFIGVIILGVGIYLANLAYKAIISSGVTESRLLAMITRVLIIFFAGSIALNQMGLADEIVNLAFGLILGAIAVAFAIAFGIGGRDTAGNIVKEISDRVRNK